MTDVTTLPAGHPYNGGQAEVGRSRPVLCHHYTSLTFHHIQKGISLSGNSVPSAVGDSMTNRKAHIAAVMLKAAYSRGGFLIPGRQRVRMMFNLRSAEFSCMLAISVIGSLRGAVPSPRVIASPKCSGLFLPAVMSGEAISSKQAIASSGRTPPCNDTDTGRSADVRALRVDGRGKQGCEGRS